MVHAIDFSAATKGDYAALGAALSSLDIGVLSALSYFELQWPSTDWDFVFAVNNVGKSYDEPMFFQDLPDQDSADIVEINM